LPRSPPIWTQAAQRAAYLVTDDAGVAAGFTVALVTEPPDDDALSPRRALHRRAGLRPAPGQPADRVQPTAEHAGGVVAATVELLTGLQAGTDYALAHLFGPVPNGRMIVSGVDVASATRARGVGSSSWASP
jgi:hypothetical protein